MKPGTLLIIGLILGLIGGLVYTWVIEPPAYENTYPPLMHAYYREDWIRMTSFAYGVEGDWERTQIRLQDLAEEEIQNTIAQTLEKAVISGEPIRTLQRLAQLAQHYHIDSPAIAIYASNAPLEVPSDPARQATATPTPHITTPTRTPVPTASPPPPTVTPSPTLTPSIATTPYQIVSQTLTCTQQPHIAITLMLSQTVTKRGRERVEQEELPMTEIWLTWDNGADRAITGFKPDLGLGYADFQVETGEIYKLYLESPTGAPISTLQMMPCTQEEGGGWLSHKLIILREDQAEL